VIRWRTVETYCFLVMLACVAMAFTVWVLGMMRRSFGAIPALLWIVLTGVSLACAAIVGVLEFTR